MKLNRFVMLFLIISTLCISCAEDMDDVIREPEASEIQDFIYRAMNEIYLYKGDVPVLADDYFQSEESYNEYLNQWSDPEDFFDELLAPWDRFSFITADYVALEDSFRGITESAGIDYIFYYYNDQQNLLGLVRYVLPGSPAAQTGIKRGDLFTQINATPLTPGNYSRLMNSSNLNLSLASLEGNTIEETGEQIRLTTQVLTENPILIHKTLNIGAEKIGYLMYNSFVADFDAELNDVFGQFKAEGISNLILDLRYNSGGRVSSATRMASMITGQYTGEIFAKQQWNEKYQNDYLDNRPDILFNYFIDKIENNVAINKLNLNSLYVIGTSGTASASELVINGLSPYINVIKVGSTTVGKSQASNTMYDSPTFTARNVNPNHTYAIQPLVYESVNANDKVVPYDGLEPDIPIEENITNMGILGDPSEPLLSAAINAIFGTQSILTRHQDTRFRLEPFQERGATMPTYQKM